MEEPQAPGLRWRVRRNGRTAIWRASKAAVKAGYPVKSADLALFADDPRMLAQRCQRLQAEMIEWMSGRRERPMNFDGTFASLIAIYQRDAESSYQKLKPSSRHPYDVYCRMLTLEIGARRIDACDGRDARRWFKAWSEPAAASARPRIAAARMAMIVLKTALSFGKACRLPGCAEFKTTIEDIRFQAPAPRQEAPSAAEIVRLREAARQIGHAPAALAYSLQFEASLRQWDVIGEWIPLNDPRPSALIDGNSKWIGPIWSQIDDNLVLRITPGKTERSSQARVILDLRSYAMVVEELAGISPEARKGPLIVNPRTGLPSTGNGISVKCGDVAPPRRASLKRFGTATFARAALPKRARPALRPTTSPRRPAIPANAQRHSSTIAIPSRLRDGWRRPEPHTAAGTKHKHRCAHRRTRHARLRLINGLEGPLVNAPLTGTI
jgi:hypothetical protein